MDKVNAIMVTGNTYMAKKVLKDAGFIFDVASKAWYGNEDNKAELDRITTASYSRTNAKAVGGLEYTKIV